MGDSGKTGTNFDVKSNVDSNVYDEFRDKDGKIYHGSFTGTAPTTVMPQ